MSVRKRNWKTASGEVREAWLADYVGTDGARHNKTFDRRKDAEAFVSKARVEVQNGVHTADADSVTVAKAGELWLTTCENRGLERTTIEGYEAHIRLHINPILGKAKLSHLSAPMLRKFEDQLREQGKSPEIIRKITTSLSGLLSDAADRGLVVRNVVRERGYRRSDNRVAKRQKGKIAIGVDIPTTAEIRAICGVLQGPWRALLLVAAFTGLRASEIRGLRWINVDLVKGELHVRERADKYSQIGAPKSMTSSRTVPLMPMVVNALREHKLQIRSEFVFPAPHGKVLSLSTIIESAWHPVQVAAGVVDKDGKAKYSGFHALRHFYASWCINAVKDGGQGLTAKAVQDRMGHSTIATTLNIYSHLMPAADEHAQMAEAERAFFS